MKRNRRKRNALTCLYKPKTFEHCKKRKNCLSNIQEAATKKTKTENLKLWSKMEHETHTHTKMNLTNTHICGKKRVKLPNIPTVKQLHMQWSQIIHVWMYLCPSYPFSLFFKKTRRRFFKIFVYWLKFVSAFSEFTSWSEGLGFHFQWIFNSGRFWWQQCDAIEETWLEKG